MQVYRQWYERVRFPAFNKVTGEIYVIFRYGPIPLATLSRPSSIPDESPFIRFQKNHDTKNWDRLTAIELVDA
jgi:hypothetical protein